MLLPQLKVLEKRFWKYNIINYIMKCQLKKLKEL